MIDEPDEEEMQPHRAAAESYDLPTLNAAYSDLRRRRISPFRMDLDGRWIVLRKKALADEIKARRQRP